MTKLEASPIIFVIVTINNRNRSTRKRNNHFQICWIYMPGKVSILRDITSSHTRPKNADGSTIMISLFKAILLVWWSFQIWNVWFLLLSVFSSKAFHSPFWLSFPPFWSKFLQANDITTWYAKVSKFSILDEIENVRSNSLLREIKLVFCCPWYASFLCCLKKM